MYLRMYIRMDSLQHYVMPDGYFGVQVETWNLGSQNGKGDVCEELRKRMIDVCCLQEVRWRVQGARIHGMDGRRNKLWWSGKDDGVGGVGVMVKEEFPVKVVEVRRVSDSDDCCCSFIRGCAEHMIHKVEEKVVL